MYDYLESMKRDIREWIEENDFYADHDRSDRYLADDLEDALWAEDSVTGNESGSYADNNEQAKEYVTANPDLCREALTEFCTEPQVITEHFLDSDWNWFDVTIRCYMLGRAIYEVLKEDGCDV